MGFFRTIFFIILIYFIIKVFRRLISPMFAGFYEKDTKRSQQTQESNKQRVNKIVIDTSKAKSKLHAKPDITRIDAEDIDFEEIK
ncbi:MAG: hypothetical protein V4616_10315 [Bacteroidota bacterium]